MKVKPFGELVLCLEFVAYEVFSHPICTLHVTELPGFDIETWTGVLAPVQMSPAVLAKLDVGISAALHMPRCSSTCWKSAASSSPRHPSRRKGIEAAL